MNRRLTVGIALALLAGLSGCGDSDDKSSSGGATTSPTAASDGGATPTPPPDRGAPVPLPGHDEVGNPLDDSFALDVAAVDGMGTATNSCTSSFVAASGSSATAADCVHVVSALSEWTAVIATVGSGHELWMACSDGSGGYTFGLRWAGVVQGITPMDDAVAGSALTVSLVDDAGVVHHVVIWDQYAGSPCPSSRVESPGAAGQGPVPQSAGVFIPLADNGNGGVCYRPVDGVWTRGDASNSAC